jgi:hypothetical protein
MSISMHPENPKVVQVSLNFRSQPTWYFKVVDVINEPLHYEKATRSYQPP